VAPASCCSSIRGFAIMRHINLLLTLTLTCSRSEDSQSLLMVYSLSNDTGSEKSSCSPYLHTPRLYQLPAVYFCQPQTSPSKPIYTVNHKKCDILFLTITLANINQFLQFLYHFNREEILHATVVKFTTSPYLCAHLTS